MEFGVHFDARAYYEMELVIRDEKFSLKLSAQRNETETKQFRNCFKIVLKLFLFQFHFVVRTVLR